MVLIKDTGQWRRSEPELPTHEPMSWSPGIVGRAQDSLARSGEKAGKSRESLKLHLGKWLVECRMPAVHEASDVRSLFYKLCQKWEPGIVQDASLHQEPLVVLHQYPVEECNTDFETPRNGSVERPW